jgi:hypothetical protein
MWDFDHQFPMSPFLIKTKAEFATIATQFNPAATVIALA